MEQLELKEKILSVLHKNYSKNLFSSYHRDDLAEQLVRTISGKEFSSGGTTENGFIDDGSTLQSGVPINMSAEEKRVITVAKAKVEQEAAKVKREVVKVEKQEVPKVRREVPKVRREVPKIKKQEVAKVKREVPKIKKSTKPSRVKPKTLSGKKQNLENDTPQKPKVFNHGLKNLKNK